MNRHENLPNLFILLFWIVLSCGVIVSLFSIAGKKRRKEIKQHESTYWIAPSQSELNKLEFYDTCPEQCSY